MKDSRFFIGHTQIVHFVGGVKRTIKGVKQVWENEMTHVIDHEDHEWVINKSNVLMVEIINKDEK